MGLIDKFTAAGQQATSRARETVHETQLRQDLNHAYSQLGRETYARLTDGQVTDPRLSPTGERIRVLERELATLARAGGSSRDEHTTPATSANEATEGGAT